MTRVAWNTGGPTSVEWTHLAPGRIINRMAKKTITQIIDDLDGSKNAETYSFAWQGTEYSIDLSNKNFKALDKLLQPYIKAGTKVTRRGRTTTSKPAKSSRRNLADVRAWAKKNGFEVSERGRVSAEVLSAYDAQ
jgi:hypothetical protein